MSPTNSQAAVQPPTTPEAGNGNDGGIIPGPVNAPFAGGLPISEAVADAAAEWLTVLMAEDVSDEDRERFEQWRRAHPDHERAWRHIEVVRGRLKVMHPGAAYQALSPFARQSGPESAGASIMRRNALRALFWAGAVSTTGLLATRTQTWQEVAADHRTATGERRRIELDDGSFVTLNTASAINVRFDGERRRLRLLAGEILVVTAHTAGERRDERPFMVETAQGRVRALGTRFTVRQQGEETLVTVLQSAVEVAPLDGAEQKRVLQAGEQATFTRLRVDTPAPASAQADAWTRGQINADEMRLGDFMAELSRYRPGLLRCSPAVADLRVSGVFPLSDTDRILASLPNVLPVQVSLRTRYWVTVEAAAK
ncbi:MAG TPA: FecR domain-containing protein [Ideonella sp.]|nr:FecR domain-containing protein [Ideonella sp.]